MSVTGLEPQDHSYLQIQGRIAGMFPGDWKVVWVGAYTQDEEYAKFVLGEYRESRRASPIFYGSKGPVEYRLVRITVRQTVTEEVLEEVLDELEATA